MCHSHAKCLITVLFLFCGVIVSAQTRNESNPLNGRENNPYTKFGIGQLMNGNNTVLRGMGNATSAYSNPYTVNADNPASYSFLERTTFEAGGTVGMNTLTGGGETYKTGTGTVSYLNLGVPVSKNSGLNFGFRPYAHTYYNMVDTAITPQLGRVISVYNGEGSLNYAYIGAGAKHKGLSIGFNAGYLFGSYRHGTALVPYDSLTVNRAYNSEFSNYTRVGGIVWKGGIQYLHKLDSTHTLRVGGTFSMKQNLAERLNAFQISNYNFGDTLVNDTVSYPGEQKGKMTLPMSYSIGVMLTRNDKWSLALDFAGTQWSGFNSTPDASFTNNLADQSYKLSMGGEYTPNINDIRKYFSRVTYRFGAYYGQDYLKINNNTLPYYGVTAGASLPFKRSLSRVHMAFDIGRLGMTSNNLLQQSYIKFTLGFSFNDKWFIPRKYD